MAIRGQFQFHIIFIRKKCLKHNCHFESQLEPVKCLRAIYDINKLTILHRNFFFVKCAI